MIDLHPELARQLLHAIPGPLALLDEDGVIIWVNEAFALLAARGPQDCVGCIIDDLDLPLRLTLGAEARRIGTGTVMMFGLGDTALTAAAGAGVLTREGALLRLEAEISRSRRYENPLSCLAARLPVGTDGEAYGGLERMLREQLRWVDVLARWSDTELLVVLPETHGRAASALVRKLAQQADHRFPALRVAWGRSTWRRGDDARLFVTRALAREWAEPVQLRNRLSR
jgi:hypothetical protein